MNRIIYTFFLSFVLLVSPQLVWGAIPDLYTNSNYLTSTHEAPRTFSSDGLGGFYGKTVSGRLFAQTFVTNSLSIKIYKFSIDEAFFYMTDKGQIWADSDIIAISIYLALG